MLMYRPLLSHKAPAPGPGMQAEGWQVERAWVRGGRERRGLTRERGLRAQGPGPTGNQLS